MVFEIYDNNCICDENGGILLCDGIYEGDKNLYNLKKKRIKCLNFIKIFCDLSIFYR